MIYNSVIILFYVYAIKKDPMKAIEKQQELQKSIFNSNKILIPLWIIVLIISVFTGFFAVGIILKSVISILRIL